MNESLNRKQLYDLVWKKPMVEVAKEYGLSDRGLAKLCERNSIPVPPRGYWAKKKAGQKVIRPPLIFPEEKNAESSVLYKHTVSNLSANSKEKGKANELPAEIKEAIDKEALSKNEIKIPKTLSNPHSIVAKWVNEERDLFQRYSQYLNMFYKPDKPTPLDNKKRRLTSALLFALEARGFKVEPDSVYTHFIWVVQGVARVGFAINEQMRQYRRELTEEEKRKSFNQSQKWTQIKEPTGFLQLKISFIAKEVS